MLLLGAILAVGLLLGWGLRGDLRSLADVRIRIWWLAPFALILQAAPVPQVEGDLGRLLPFASLLLSYLVLIVVVVVNWRLRGFVVILLGLLMNTLVIGLNQGMPVSGDALTRIGSREAVERLREADPGSKHHLATEDDVLVPLGDVIAVGAPFSVVLSVGDVFAYTGGAIFLASAMRGRPRREPRTEEPPDQQATWS